MKRKGLLAAMLLGMGLFVSCGLDEFEDILRHPIHVQGEVNPQWGVPAAYGEMNFNDILNRLGGEITGYVDPNDDLLTVVYKTDTVHEVFNARDSKRAKRAKVSLHAVKDDNDLIYRDTIIRLKPTTIDFFKNVIDSEHMDFEINHLWMNLNVGVWVRANTLVSQYMRAKVDSINLEYTDKDGRPVPFDALNNLTFDIENVDAVNQVRKEIKMDLASIVNDLPQSVQGSFRLSFAVSKEILNDHTLAGIYFKDIPDSINKWSDEIQMSALEVEASGDVRFPMELKVNKLDYQFDVNIDNTGTSINIDSLLAHISDSLHGNLDSSYVIFYLENGIPLNLRLAASIIDYKGNLDTLLSASEGDIAAAQTEPVPGDPTVERATGATFDTVPVLMTGELLEKFGQATRLRIDVKVKTDATDDTGDKTFVQMHKTDFLRIRVVLVARARVNAEFPLTNGGLL